MIEIIGYLLIITLLILVKNLKSTKNTNRNFRVGDVVKVGGVVMLLKSYDAKNHIFNAIDEQGRSCTISEECLKFSRK